MRLQTALTTTFIILAASAGSGFELKSSVEQVSVLELYTSEGCSSCPPADKWISELKGEPGLWRDFVPLSFHVDYWNYIGWEDRFAKPEFTTRQRELARGKQMYTPEFFLGGTEWRLKDKAKIKGPLRKVGVLSALAIGGDSFEVQFKPQQIAPAADWVIHAVQLSNGLVTEVGAGENRGNSLKHDFVVRSHSTVKVTTQRDGTIKARVALPRRPLTKNEKAAVAFWITQANEVTPLQAVGGYLVMK